MMKNGEYKLESTDGKARAGVLMTAHGEVKTPCFMPVGTKASVKSLDPSVVKDLGAQVVLANTYHLFLAPGSDLVKKMGGLHNFMQWDGPILTDSGGFQVFSLGAGKKNRTSLSFLHTQESSLDYIDPRGEHEDDNIEKGVVPETKISEAGVEFKSYKDGSTHFIGPEESIETQTELGADIIMAFDECPPYPSTEEYYIESMHRTHRWLERCIDKKKELESRHSGKQRASRIEDGSWTSQEDKSKVVYHQNTPKDQLLFGIVQGGMSKAGRVESAKFVAGKDLPGIAIGGVANGGESRDLMMKQVEWALAELPDVKPRYLMGIGTPLDLIEFVERGIDMFDCVLPTRLGRNGAAWIIENDSDDCHSASHIFNECVRRNLWIPGAGPRMTAGKGMRIQIKNAKYATDPKPLMEGCQCSTCTRFSRAYIHHLFKEDEPLGMQLLSIHNIHILLDIMNQVREAIMERRFETLSKELKAIWG